VSRIRSIKPEWLDDELMVSASPEARVLSVALLCLADDYGNGRAGRVWLGARVFPGMPLETLDRALQVLVSMRYVLLYEVDGQTYYAVRNWEKHQRVDKPGQPKVPGPNLASARHDDGKPPPNNSQEFPARPQELPVIPPGSRASSSLLSDSSSLFQASSDQPEKPGSARARSKPSAKAAALMPFLMHDGWEPPAELVTSLAASWSVSAARIAATTKEFRYFWKSRGDRKKQAGWERAYSSNVERQAKSGALFVGVLLPTPGATENPDVAAIAARRAEAEARVLGKAAP
jgi:hypothetical protein